MSEMEYANITPHPIKIRVRMLEHPNEEMSSSSTATSTPASVSVTAPAVSIQELCVELADKVGNEVIEGLTSLLGDMRSGKVKQINRVAFVEKVKQICGKDLEVVRQQLRRIGNDKKERSNVASKPAAAAAAPAAALPISMPEDLVEQLSKLNAKTHLNYLCMLLGINRSGLVFHLISGVKTVWCRSSKHRQIISCALLSDLPGFKAASIRWLETRKQTGLKFLEAKKELSLIKSDALFNNVVTPPPGSMRDWPPTTSEMTEWIAAFQAKPQTTGVGQERGNETLGGRTGVVEERGKGATPNSSTCREERGQQRPVDGKHKRVVTLWFAKELKSGDKITFLANVGRDGVLQQMTANVIERLQTSARPYLCTSATIPIDPLLPASHDVKVSRLTHNGVDVDLDTQIDIRAWAAYNREDVFSRPKLCGPMRGNSGDDNDDVSFSDENISLLDPLSLTRIQIPCKGSACVHNRAFDLDTFIGMCVSKDEIDGTRWGKRRNWKCPLCDKRCVVRDLSVCGWVESVLQATSSNIESIWLSSDGTWKAVEPRAAKLSSVEEEEFPQPSRKRMAAELEATDVCDMAIDASEFSASVFFDASSSTMHAGSSEDPIQLDSD
tara:strand:+ start:905 stop:2740 length:1836 start_codon:yes stop_codon:yes gene_type:complete